jgi:hypothetical protein
MVAALEDCETNQRHLFPCLAALVEFLETANSPPRRPMTLNPKNGCSKGWGSFTQRRKDF